MRLSPPFNFFIFFIITVCTFLFVRLRKLFSLVTLFIFFYTSTQYRLTLCFFFKTTVIMSLGENVLFKIGPHGVNYYTFK